MNYTKRSLEDLNVLDDFLINMIATDEEIGKLFCRELLSVLLRREIGEIQIKSQRAIPGLTPELRGIRLDVEITEDKSLDNSLPAMNIYDVEPHLKNDIDIVRHNRFYQARIDGRYLKSGTRNFTDLPNLYIITILNYDPFGYDYMMYTVHNCCEEVPELIYEDGLQFIYYNVKGKKGGSQSIKNMLQYCSESTIKNVTDDSTRKIHEYISKVKIQPEVRDLYMTFEDKIYFERKEAAKEAAKEATKEATHQTIIHCISQLLEDYGDISETLMNRLQSENDIDILEHWLKLAAKVNSIDEFITKME